MVKRPHSMESWDIWCDLCMIFTIIVAQCDGIQTNHRLKGSFFCRIWFIFHRICTEKDSIHTVPTMNKNHIQRFWSTIVVVVILQSWIMVKKYQSPWELTCMMYEFLPVTSVTRTMNSSGEVVCLQGYFFMMNTAMVSAKARNGSFYLFL